MSRACAALGAVALLGLAGCGGSGGDGDAGSSSLAWQGKPVAYSSATKPRDRVVVAKVRNTSSKPVRVDAAKVKVRDADGRELRSYARFIAAYAHGLYPAYQKPSELPPGEIKRLGYVVTVPAGKTAPITLAWQAPAGAATAATVDLGVGRLDLPSGFSKSH